MRLFDDADEVEAALLLAVDFAEEPEVGVDAFEAVLGGFVRREGEDQVLHAVAVDVLESHLRRLGALQVHVDVRVRIGDAEDEAFLLGLGEIEALFAEDDHVNHVLLGEGERIGENFDLERLHVLEGVFKKRDRDVVGFGRILMEVCLGLVLRDVLFKILGGLENGIAFRKPLGLLGVDNLAEVGAGAVVKIVDQVLGLQSRVETEVGLEVEAIRRGMEVLGRCNFRRHEGLGFGRLGEREERNVRGLARTGGRAPAAREQGFGVHFVNHGFERADVADVAHRLMEEAARAGFALPVAGDGQQTTESQREFMRRLLSADDATNKASNRIGGKEPRPISDRPFEDYSPCSWSAEGEEALKLKPMAEKPLKPEEFWAVVKPIAERIRTMLDNILRTQTRSGIYFSSNGRRVNNTVISRLAVGNPRIMEKRLEPRTGLDTAVALLLDTSGSMGRKRMQAARDASAALIAAVRQLKGCNASMRVFPGTSFSKAVKSKLLIPMGHSNLSATDVNRLCHVESWGATPILHALCAGISELEGRTESRKVIILITDGTTFGQDPDLAKAWKKRAEASGIEIFTLMLGDDADCEGNRALSTRFAFLDDNETSDTVTGTPAMVRCISQFAVQGIFGPR